MKYNNFHSLYLISTNFFSSGYRKCQRSIEYSSIGEFIEDVKKLVECSNNIHDSLHQVFCEDLRFESPTEFEMCTSATMVEQQNRSLSYDSIGSYHSSSYSSYSGESSSENVFLSNSWKGENVMKYVSLEALSHQRLPSTSHHFRSSLPNFSRHDNLRSSFLSEKKTFRELYGSFSVHQSQDIGKCDDYRYPSRDRVCTCVVKLVGRLLAVVEAEASYYS